MSETKELNVPYTQVNRLIAIQTPLGSDAVLLQSFTGHEGISKLFSFELELLSEGVSRISASQLVGQRVNIAIALVDGSYRNFNGFISRFGLSGASERFTTYTAEMVPWFWFLTRTTNCRIFQQLSIPGIIDQIFSEHNFHDFRNILHGEYEPREYCVQYRETDFAFVSRLMEEHGIFYYFEHADNKHTLVMADSLTACQSCPGQPKARYEQVRGVTEDEDTIFTWSAAHELRPGRYSLTDYNFETPSLSLAVEGGGSGNPVIDTSYEIYDYPGLYLKKAQGEQVVRLRMEEEELPQAIYTADSTCRALASGYKFELLECPLAELGAKYLLTAIHHAASAGGTYTQAGIDDVESYSNRFNCISSTVAFRPSRETPIPVVQGPQTAMVVGPVGEEIYTDKYGRVKVQFHWDRLGKRDENSSCWMRVSQPWGGKGWGGMWIPRIGQEVIVEFLEGDPDRPIITGRVYNAEQMPPYDLPEHSTRSTMKSRSSKGGSAKNFNELRFEDKKGAEQLFLHAERDCDQRSKNDSREWVGNDRSLMIQGNQKESVEGNKHAKVTGDQAEQITGKMSLKVGGDCHQQIGSLYVVQSGQEIHLTSGMKVVIDAGMQLTIKAAGGFIDIGPAGVTIQGIMVNINSGGSVGSGSGCSPDDPEKPDVADDGTQGGKMS